MSVHQSGDGAAWAGLETLDVDQPHGKDYQQSKHLAIAVRKRVGHEHVTFADGTVGGKHLPGGARILGIVENTSDLSKGYGDASYDITDGMFMGRGLVYDQTNNAFWCATGDGTVSDDPYKIMFGPNSICSAGDYTFNIGEFDASVDISGNVGLDGDLSIDGTLAFQDAVLTGDSTFTFDPIAGETGPIFKIFGDWSSRSNNTTYTARTDGFVTAIGTAASQLNGYTPSGTVRCQVTPGVGENGTITMPVKGGNTWDVSGAATVYWLPLGDNT